MINAEVLAAAIKNEIPDIYRSTNVRYSIWKDKDRPIFVYDIKTLPSNLKIGSPFQIKMQHKDCNGLFMVTSIKSAIPSSKSTIPSSFYLHAERIHLKEMP